MAPTGPPPGAPLRALVVDDIPEICDFYRALFARIRGMKVELTIETDPREAIRRLRADPYDLVISDFRMKQADGVDVLTAARAKNPQGRRVLMTGYNEIPTSIERIREARIDGYLHKPLKVQELLIMVADFLAADESRLQEYRAHAQEIEEIALREESKAPPRATLGA